MADIRQGMDVISSDVQLIGRTGAYDGGPIPLTLADGGATRHVPLDYVTRVDEHVHLRHSADAIRGEWRGSAAHPHPTEGRARVPWLIGIVLLLIAVFLLIWGFVYAADDSTDTRQALPSTGQS